MSTTGRNSIRASATVAGVLLALACGRTQEAPKPAPAAASAETPAAATCPKEPIASERAPGTRAQHRDLATWLDRLTAQQRQEVLVDATALSELHRTWSEVPGSWRDPFGPDATRAEATDETLTERLDYLQAQLLAGKFVEGEPGALSAARSVSEGATEVDHQRLVVSETPLRCVPTDVGLFKVPVDAQFDRNACSSLHPGERVRVLRRAQDDWLFVHAGYTTGWVRSAGLSSRLSRAQLDAWESGERLVPLEENVRTQDGIPIRVGVSVPIVSRDDEGYDVLVAGPEGPRQARVSAEAPVHAGIPALTREALLRVVFSMLDAPYGWGGRGGSRDCSRLLRDALATFGIQLGRHSGVQAQAGTISVDVEGLDEASKLAAIEQWAEQGLVLLYMPGHIMLYLGKDSDDHYAISSISEWLEPCPGGPDTVHRIDKVAVTTLELGRDTERTAFIERLTRLAVFGPTPRAEYAAEPAAIPSE